MSSSFNASVAVTELLTKTLENVSKDLASRCIKECGLRYGFNSDDAIRELGLENLALIKKKMSRKSVSVSSSMSSSSNDKIVQFFVLVYLFRCLIVSLLVTLQMNKYI